jgi:hypothetical protein
MLFFCVFYLLNRISFPILSCIRVKSLYSALLYSWGYIYMFIASKELTSCLWFFPVYLIRLLAIENSFIFFLWFTDRLCLLEKSSSILDRLEIKDPFIPLLVLFLGFRYVSGCINNPPSADEGDLIIPQTITTAIL